jgi:hypothetical protein
VATLLLAGRRQVHAEEVAAVTEKDAVERRITELYLKAVDQLGSDKAPVRLGGLLALERLAQDNPQHRQPVVDVVCSYLRMPVTYGEISGLHSGPAMAPVIAAHLAATEGGAAQRQELEVRMTAQSILRRHVVLDPGGLQFWPDIDLDLKSATLVDFRLERCRVRDVRFTGATFVGIARFFESVIDGEADFAAARTPG